MILTPRFPPLAVFRWAACTLCLAASLCASAQGTLLPTTQDEANRASPSARQQAATDAPVNQSPGAYRLNQTQDGRQSTGGPGPSGSSTALQRRGFATFDNYKPGEFEIFVQRLAGSAPVSRFGVQLMTTAEHDPLPAEGSALIPPDYVVKTGDELLVTLWGAVDADLRLTVDRSGRVTIPRVGPVLVAGVRYSDLPSAVSQRVSQVFRNFQISVSLGKLRAMRVYVTGFVNRPGSYSVGSLTTVVQALFEAGGPSSAGSLRHIEVRRGSERIATLDLYDFLVKGDRSADRILQADDVIHVGPVLTQVALLGSVNRPAIFELKSGEAVSDVLRMAGGFSAVADRSRLAVERLDDRATVRVAELALPASLSANLSNGDVLRAFSAVDVALPVKRQNKRVRIEGEVLRPGEYVLPPDSTIVDGLAAAGGLTSFAFPFGTEFTRESVRATQQVNYDRALRDMETDLARNSSTQRASNSDEAAAQAARDAGNARLVASLRALRPTGRIVLQIPPDGRELPSLALEDGDKLYVPPRPTSVGVFGSVFNAGSYLFGDGRSVEDYLNLAGGPTRGADSESTFVVRANGGVISGRQRSSGWLRTGTSLAGVRAEPGDTVFVPEEVNKTTFVQNAKDWTQILYQFGIGLAAIKTLGQ